MRFWILSFWLLASSVVTKAIERVEGTWEVLDGCRLVSAPFNDGDSFLISHRGETYTFRLFNVDALETSETYIDRISDQARYFDMPPERVTVGGNLAKEFTRKLLRGKFTVITRWEDARGSSRYKRYFALIRQGEKYLSSELVLAGLARLYGKPIESRWPGGIKPHTFYERLKESERQAKVKGRGLWAFNNRFINGEDTPKALIKTSDQPIKSLTDINTASSSDLQKLPGIGAALATRIIDARPIKSMDSLVEISGISANTLDAFSHMVIVKEPPPPPLTAAFHRANPSKHLNTVVTVRVSYVDKSTKKGPDSFRAVSLKTSYNGKDGGMITAFIPDEFYESFRSYYSDPGRDFSGLLYKHEGELVIVYQRK